MQAAAARQYGLPLTSTLDLGRGVKLDLMLIPAGEFIMGSPRSEEGRYDTEGPQHQVRIKEAFYMGKYAVTQVHWQVVMGANPARFRDSDNLPAERVSWYDCVAFCSTASTHTGRPVRLPSEAEWEYACRAGSSSVYYFGDSRDELGLYAWYRDNAREVSHPVGSKQPNAWGLYDVHGGIDEFCQDVWHSSYDGAPDDGSAWLQGGDPDRRILRGGSWYDIAQHCRSAHRNAYPRSQPSEDHGFRVVVSLA